MKNTSTATKHTDVTQSIVSESQGWDEAGDYGDIQFYNATLAIDTKKFKKGDVVETIAFCYTANICEIYEKYGTEENGFQPTRVVESFKLKLLPDFN